MIKYLPRVVDAELDERLASIGAVLIEGPKACGKTETASQRASSVVRFDTNPPPGRRSVSILMPSSNNPRRSSLMSGSVSRRSGITSVVTLTICAGADSTF
jgi:hypothetical protein